MSEFRPYQLRGHIVSPRSILSIRGVAEEVREIMSLPDGKVPLAEFIESWSTYGITLDVLEDEDFTLWMADVEAVCVPETATITLTDTTYNAARRNDPRTRFTIFHELGHFVLQHSKVLARRDTVAKPYLDSEWQADQFAAEVTMPLRVIQARGLNHEDELATHFGVSLPAAANRLRSLRRENVIQ
jgi:predicted transcriptional regulator